MKPLHRTSDTSLLRGPMGLPRFDDRPAAGRAPRVRARDTRWFVNGKFLGHRTTGTERFARGMLGALDALLPATADWTLLCPPDAVPPPLRTIRVQAVGPRGLPPHVWEQVVLPQAARSGRLLNLAGSAPRMAGRQTCVIHDAAVFDRPDAYGPVFAGWYRSLFRSLGRGAETLITVSEFSRGRLADALGVSADRLQVVPEGGDHLCGVTQDDAVLDRLGLRGRTYLLAVASANPTKNLERLLDAWQRLGPDPEVRLVLVGGANTRVFAGASKGGGKGGVGGNTGGNEDGDTSLSIDASTNASTSRNTDSGTDGNTSKQAPSIVRAGTVDDAALKALYAHARALVFPSTYEGFGLPPVEAMRCGCPVIVASSASLPEVCGDAALYVDPSSTDEIAAAMRRVIGDDALCADLRVRGLGRARELTWAAAAAHLLEVLPGPGSRG